MADGENTDDLDGECFKARHDDLECWYLIDAVARMCRALLERSGLDPETRLGLQRAVSALQRFPSVTPGVHVECSLSLRGGDENAGEMRFWAFCLSDAEFEVSSGGHVYTRDVGGDTYTNFDFYINKSGGRACDGDPVHWVEELEDAMGLAPAISVTDESHADSAAHD